MMASNRLGNLKTGDEFVVKSLNKESELDPPTVLDPIRPVLVRQEIDARLQQRARQAPQSGVQLAQGAAPQAAAPPANAVASRAAAPAGEEPRGSRLPWAIAAIAIGVLLGVGASAFLSKRTAKPATPVATNEATQASQAAAPAPANTEESLVFGGKIQRADTAAVEAKPPATAHVDTKPEPPAADPKPVAPPPEVKHASAPPPEPKHAAAPPPPAPEPKPVAQPVTPKPAPVAKVDPKPEPKPTAAAPAEPKPTAKADPKPAKPGKGGNDVEAAARDAELLKKQLAETIP